MMSLQTWPLFLKVTLGVFESRLIGLLVCIYNVNISENAKRIVMYVTSAQLVIITMV